VLNRLEEDEISETSVIIRDEGGHIPFELKQEDNWVVFNYINS
jgi:hypothetical protein